MQINTTKGLLTEIQCQLAFSSLGILVSQPITSDSRYDFIVDINNKLYRIQCKTPEMTTGGFSIRCHTKNWNTKILTKYDETQIDFFYTVFNDESYLVPIADVNHQKNFCIRVVDAERQDERIHFAENYLLEKQLEKLGFSKDENFVDQTRNRTFSDLRKPKKILKEKVKEEYINKEISREELKMLIRTQPFTEIGKSFGVTDNAVRKWCKNYKLPSTKREINAYLDEDWSKV